MKAVALGGRGRHDGWRGLPGDGLLPRTKGEVEFAAAGIALVACQVLLIAATRGLDHDTAAGLAAVAPMILGLAVPTALLLALAPRLCRTPPSPFVWVVLVIAGLALRGVWFGSPPPLEDDYQRYLWDGAVVARGLDPYAYAPEIFAGHGGVLEAYREIAGRGQSVLGAINFPEVRTIYPGAAQAAFTLAHVIAPFKADGLRVVFLAGEIATLGLLIAMLRGLGVSGLWSVLYWWNPFVAAMLVGIVHVDALIPPLVLGAVLAMSRGKAMAAVALIGLGAGVKVWPLILAPMALWPLRYAPRRLIAACVLLGAVLAAVLGPVLLASLRPGSGLSAYAASWSNNNAFYSWALYGVAGLVGSWETAGMVVRPALALATAGVALVMATRGDQSLGSLSRRALIVAAAMFYLSPTQFPWYAAWFLPLAVLARSWPLLLASATLPSYYLFYPLWPWSNGVWFFYGTAFIHSTPVLGWLLYRWHTGRQAARRAGDPQIVARTTQL